MSIADKFARSLGFRDESPNKELAHQIVRAHDTNAINEIITLIQARSSSKVMADALKVLEVVGNESPQLAAPVFEAVFPLLLHNINQIQWRTMTVLGNIAAHHQDALFQHLGEILEIMDEGSVVARDHGFKILIVLYKNPKYKYHLPPVLTEQILSAPDNQLGQYAEKWMKVIDKEHVQLLINVLETRLPDLVSESHCKRNSLILQKLNKLK